MGDKITEQERQAISSYVTGGGVVTRCPPGAAIGAGNADVHTFGEYLAELGLTVVPIRRNDLRSPERNHTLDVTTLLKIAA